MCGRRRSYTTPINILFADRSCTEVLRINISNVHCEHVLLACCHDAGYIPVLRQYAAQDSARKRITLLSGGRLRSDMSDLGFPTTSIFQPLFSSSGSLPLTSPKSPPAIPQLPVTAGPAFQKPATDQIAVHGRTLSNGNVDRETLSLTEDKPVSMSGRLGPVLRNIDGKRIDKALHVDNSLVQALKIINLCHFHFLKTDCTMIETSCKRNHNFPRPLPPGKFDALWCLSRQNVCNRTKKGKVCEDDQCIYGHT